MPYTGVDQFAGLFEKLESSAARDMGVLSFGVSLSSLEGIWFRPLFGRDKS